MKMERIDDNSIKCTLTSLDLSSRNINLRDMKYGSQAVRRLFDEMMQKAQEEFGFIRENNTALMVEAVPLQSGSIQLTITKVDDPEELDTRFSKFTKGGTMQNEWVSQLASQILEGAHDILQKLHTDEQKDVSENDADMTSQDQVRIYRFSGLNQVCHAAEALGGVYSGSNTLYKDERNNRFYLVLHEDKTDEMGLQRASNLLPEYGERLQGDELQEAYFEEHLEALIRGDALQKLAVL